ncbi:MAG: peptidase C11 [Lachnospiraceae bacterium]|nr:peptidase C11 [Lachnospiraceae bacterium]
MAQNRPRGRQRNVTGQGKSVKRRGAGLGTGPVGSSGGYAGRPGSSSGLGGGDLGGTGSSLGRPRGVRGVRSGGSGGMLKLIIIALVVLLGGGGGIGSLLSSDGLGSLLLGGTTTEYPQSSNSGYGSQSAGSGSQSSGYGDLSDLFGNMSSIYGNLGGGNVSSGWDGGSNTAVLDTSVDRSARDKYTDIKGGGKDEVTIMVYMCGTDLESRSKMATSDLQEMIDAKVSDKVNLLVYTGGCKRWQNNLISSSTNQIWQVRDDGLLCLEKDLGSVSMTDEDTLAAFIKWCAKEFPANRNSLIFWDHGGGSVSGYGYDEKFASTGSMSLAAIDRALEEADVKFDFVGFDACLMATAENALMLTEHADYMIASEETEPGIGWYYTDWLRELSKDSSMSTLKVGKNIIDDFVDTCARKCAGQSTTLSIVDLAEFEATVPDTLAAFSSDTCDLIRSKEYATVSNARSGTREFGSSNKIDQIDLVHLAKNMDTEEGRALAEALLGTVKYNRTSSNMTNSYGVSIYFPFRKASMVDKAVDTYEQIGMDEEYMRCIQEFASMEVSGQAAGGGTASPIPSLSGSFSGGSADMLSQILGSFLAGNVSNISGLNMDNIDFLSGRALSEEDLTAYISENSFDGSLLQWTDTENGPAIVLPEEEWALVQTLQANLFMDDGEGYIDLGLDNVYSFDEEGNLLAPAEFTWLAVSDQPVAYYHESTVDDGEHYSITGRIPVLYNGERAELVVEFTDDNPYGSVVGVRSVYVNGETTTVAKTMDTVKNGDIIDFICDYYSYDGEYLDSYMLGEQLIVEGELVISDVYVDQDMANLTYLFTDIYNQSYWTAPVD